MRFSTELNWCCRSHRPIHHDDVVTLIHLYQPIIGGAAISLYLTLYYQLPFYRSAISDIHTHEDLLRFCGMSMEQWLKARYLLEGIGLLNSYEKIDEDAAVYYEYELIPPLSPLAFFQSDVLIASLYHALGKERALWIRQHLIDACPLTETIQTGIDRTKSFGEVFGVLNPHQLKQVTDVATDIGIEMRMLRDDKTMGNPPKVHYDENDFIMIKQRLRNQVSNNAWTSQLMEKLGEIRFLYQLSEQDLLKALQHPSVIRRGVIDIKKLCKFVRSEYQHRFSSDPAVVKKEVASSIEVNPENSDQTVNKVNAVPITEQDKKRIHQLSVMSPIQVLYSYQNGGKVPDSDIELVESLTMEFGLPPEVATVLVEHVLLKYNFNFSRNLVEKIAGQWKRLGIKTAEEAFEHSRRESEEIKRKQENNTKVGGFFRWDRRESLPMPKSIVKQMKMAKEENVVETAEQREKKEQERKQKQAYLREKIKWMHEELSQNN